MTIVYSLSFESDWDFANIESVFNTGERSEPEKNFYKKVCPSPTHQTFTLDLTSEKLRGGGGGSRPTTYAWEGSLCSIL